MEVPRVLAFIGSGETSPAMARAHADLARRLPPARPGVVVDTPYGFQENADELTARQLAFFEARLRRPFEVASFRSRASADAAATAAAVAAILGAGYVFAGPGSPSYAVRQWAGSAVGAALVDKVENGGIVVLASAAALTAGAFTIPVYEIYKVGEEPRWLPGLNLLGAATGLRAAVVPHFDNGSGGTHDTRFCFVGERRLRSLEAALPPDAFVLGIDEHTALVLDLADGSAVVRGRGGVTVRVRGSSVAFPSGTRVPTDQFAEAAAALGAATATATAHDGARPRAGDGASDRRVADLVADLEATRGRRADASAARRDAIAPLVELLVDVRDRARSSGDWASADRIRAGLAAAGVSLRDGPLGTTWLMDGADAARH
jgi:cyanophycinase-like exopeptidase